jgi:hypothetical protein
MTDDIDHFSMCLFDICVFSGTRWFYKLFAFFIVLSFIIEWQKSFTFWISALY